VAKPHCNPPHIQWLRSPPDMKSASAAGIPPEAQHAMSKRAGSTVVEVKGSHAVYVSQPEAVAALIQEAAQALEAASHLKSQLCSRLL
jgi:pimeloyl-ACP methyl ester carboxylesterase